MSKPSVHRLLSTFMVVILTIIADSALAKDKLVFVIDVMRHGQRTPVIQLPENELKWQQGLGQLTAEGMHSAYLLGQQRRQQLIGDLQLLPKHYQASLMQVRASHFNRTVMTAQAFLMGLYPPGTGPKLPSGKDALPNGFQPIPIFTVPKKKDTLLLVSKQKRLARLKQYQKKHPPKLELDPTAITKLQQVTGLDLSSHLNQVKLADNLLVRMQQGRALPPGLTKAPIKSMIQKGFQMELSFLNDPDTGVCFSKKFLERINQQLHQATTPDNKLHYQLYAAHDSTIVGLLSALSVPLTTWPNYLATVEFQLLQNETGDFHVALYYQNQLIQLPFCQHNYCTLKELQHYVQTRKVNC